MKGMSPESARALIGTAALLLLIGFMVMSPSAAFLAFGLAALLAAPAAILGSGKSRVVAALLLLGALGLAAARYPDFTAEQQQYRQRHHSP